MIAGKTGSVASKTGDVLVFIEYLIHGWLGSGISRYQICANFGANPKTERHPAQIKQFYDTSTWAVPQTPKARHRIRQMVQKPLEWEFEGLDF